MHVYAEFVNPYLAQRLQQLKLDKVFPYGQGCRLTDENGREYLDFIASYGALPFGYNHPEIWEALLAVRNSREPSFVQPSYLNAAGELAEKLISLAPDGLKCVTFANSGAEAVEAAIKLARSATGRMGIITTRNSFHGKTLGALSATGKDSYQQGFGAPVAGFTRIPYGDITALTMLLDERPREFAALILEPIQGEGGIVLPPEGYLAEALHICHVYGVLLIADEVQTGLGRTGKMFAVEHERVTPDIMTLAKALGGGLLPVGACLCTESVYHETFGLKHSSTFAGNAPACRVGIKTLELLTRDNFRLIKQAAVKGEFILNRLRKIYAAYPEVIAAVRGRGLMIGLEFGITPESFPDSLLGIMGEQDFLAPLASSYLLNVERLRVAPTLNGAKVIRLEPSLTITQEECAEAMKAVERMTVCLAGGQTAPFLAHLIEADLPPVKGKKASVKHYPVPSDDEGRFAFLVHPLNPGNYADFDPSLGAFSQHQLARLVERWNDLIEPFVVSKARICSKTGQQAYGEFICVSRTSEELMNMPREQAISEIGAAVRLAQARGARVVGLGAYTSVVTKGGRDLRHLGVALTTGNSYTVAAAVEATLEATRRLGVDVTEAVAAVVGATGSIGRATALLLAEKVKSLILIGNPLNPDHSRRRLTKVSAEIYRYIRQNPRQCQGQLAERIRNHPLVPAIHADLDEYINFAERIRSDSPLMFSLDLAGDLPRADLIVTATSQVNTLIHPEMLKFGAVVCDVARPPDVSLDVKAARPDVLVIDGGVIALPGMPDLGWNFGFEKGLAYACMSETMMLALEGHSQHFSLGIEIDPESIAYTRAMAEKHGFKLAGLRSFDRPLSEEAWESVLRARSRQKIPIAVND